MIAVPTAPPCVLEVATCATGRKKKRFGPQQSCLFCGTAFSPRIGKRPVRFCTLTCWRSFRSAERQKRARVCETCGLEFVPLTMRWGGRFCSIPCSGRARLAKKTPYRGGGNQLRDHQKIAQAALGRPLPPTAHVHHVNGDGRDNRNSNLVICQDATYHKLLHVRTRIVKAGGDPNTQRICGKCKAPTAIASMRRYHCVTCARALRRERTAKESS